MNEQACVGMPEVAQGVITLTLYTRKGCHLCEDMALTLAEFSAEYNYRVESVDIDSDPQLRERYHVLVPVLCIGEKEVCHHFLDLSALITALDEIAC